MHLGAVETANEIGSPCSCPELYHQVERGIGPIQAVGRIWRRNVAPAYSRIHLGHEGFLNQWMRLYSLPTGGVY